ncbi:MAG: DeoR/GlpR family DNA-binding transcription regulator [Candidatus Fimivivens sp.]|nr:DeoR/GlpR family DNA-binding transcription regulator [Candidatus Fimivivens sp.]
MILERRSLIIEKIKQERMVKVAELIAQFGVSIETVRRDLEYLEKQGILKRVYGGAVIAGLYGEEPTYSHREVINFEEKKAIGIKASQFIDDGDTVFIDVGTTTREVAKNLLGKQNLTVITNATLIAHELIKNESCRVILLGGELRKGELSVAGFLTDKCIEYFNANKLIIGVGGITLSHGITDYNIEEANTRRMMIKRADKIIAVADYSKFGVTAMNNVCALRDVDTLVTDWSVSQKTISEIKLSGINVAIAAQP